MTGRSLAGAGIGALAAVLFLSSAATAAVVISTKPTKNMSCTNGVCTPTAKKAVLNVTDPANMLAGGDVTVASDSATLDIRFAAPLSWTSTSRLTLSSYRSILVEQPATVAGKGALTLISAEHDNNGTISYEKRGHFVFWDLDSNLVVNGAVYTLVNSISMLAGAVASNPYDNYALASDYDASPDGNIAHRQFRSSMATQKVWATQSSNWPFLTKRRTMTLACSRSPGKEANSHISALRKLG